MKKVVQSVIVVTLVLTALSGCKSRGDLNTQYSNTTGWNYYEKKTTNFEAKEGVGNVDPIGMVAIQGGTFAIGQTDEFVTAPRDNARRSITVSSFYMDKYEISNLNWREYMHWMEMVFGYANPPLVRSTLPDTLVWRDELAYNEPYVENYLRHPAFSFYPVVGVSWTQAMDYCQWRTDRVNELALVNAGAIEFPDFDKLRALPETELEEWRNENPGYEPLEVEVVVGHGEDTIKTIEYHVPNNWICDKFVFNTEKYLVLKDYNPVNPDPNRRSKKFHDAWGNPRKVDRTDGILVTGYRLPTEAEWEFAAFAPIAGTDGLTIEGKVYPWSGYHPRDLSKNNMGMMQANFIRGKGDMMGVSGMLNDGYVITNPVDAFAPNDFGLYNMAGNVNEWVMDVYRETTYQDVTEYNSFRGNIYTRALKNDKGEYEVNSRGCIAVTWDSDEDDKRSYLDGDFASMIQTDYPLDTLGALFLKNFAATEGNNAGGGGEEEEEEEEEDDENKSDDDANGDDNTNADNADEEEEEGGDDRGSSVKKIFDATDIYAPKITVNTRVYKGGSWNDRVYWLHPSSRRYLDANKSKSTIGFRCAMSTLGDQVASGPRQGAK